ncbi:MAG: hypothetical protein HXS44_00435 [Theionarchaea archaeon]|nr:hypothetical protein [Theionarchaea archaeon]
MTVEKEIHSFSPEKHRSFCQDEAIYLTRDMEEFYLIPADTGEGIFYSQESQEFFFEVLERFR